MKEIVTVKYVNAPAAGKKKGNIKTNDGKIFGVCPDKLSEFKVGGTYEIETESNEFNGKTYYSVKSATPVNGASPAAAQPATNGNGRSPETQARIERQHSQEMSLRLLEILTDGGAEVSEQWALEKIKAFTDHFQRDIANTVVKGETGDGFDL